MEKACVYRQAWQGFITTVLRVSGEFEDLAASLRPDKAVDFILTGQEKPGGEAATGFWAICSTKTLTDQLLGNMQEGLLCGQ